MKRKHFAVTAGWGHAGQGGVTMPGKGKIIDRDYTRERAGRALGEAIRAGSWGAHLRRLPE